MVSILALTKNIGTFLHKNYLQDLILANSNIINSKQSGYVANSAPFVFNLNLRETLTTAYGKGDQ